MTERRTGGFRALDARQGALSLAAFAASLPFLLPFLWLGATAFKPEDQIFASSLSFWPHPPTMEHFRRIFEEFPFFLYLRNTVIITVGTLVGAVFSSLVVSYALSHLEWPDRKGVFALLMMTMMLPPQVTMIPAFLIFRRLGWINTFAPLIVPAFLGNAFSIFLLRQFLLGLPKALIESARIDGAREPTILFAIVAPLAKPAILTVALFSGIGAWNDFLGPLIYLSSDSHKTLALGLQGFMGQYASEWGMLMAASLLMAAPVLILFLLAQRQFVQGIALTGIKG